MHAVEPLHSPTAEEIMEYVDGEGAPAARDRIAAHVEGCPTCQGVVASQRELTNAAHRWTVAPPPASLRPPVIPATPARERMPWLQWLRRPRFGVMTLGAVAAVAIAIVMVVPLARQAAKPVTASSHAVSLAELSMDAATARSAGARGVIAGQAGGGGGGRRAEITEIAQQSSAPAPRMSSVIRTATLRIIARDFASARQTVESVVAGASGFIDQMTVTGDASVARQLHGTLRVPGDRLADVLTRLRAIGAVTEDTQGSRDVTDQIVDLDARLASARATEKRLTELLQNRTGKLSDVLDVERELARVRLDIERLDAEQTNIGRRVTYATIDISVVEERKAAIESGPLSLATQVRLAALDGIDNVLDSAAGVLLFVLRVGPALVFWGVLILPLVLLLRRRGFRMRDSR